MREIVKRLKEQREIELAKSILEAHGYRYKLVPKSSESIAKALKTRVWSDKYTHVFSLDHKSILYTEPGVAPENQRYVGVIHAPFSDGEDEYMYVPWIWDTQDEYHDPESPEEFEFSTEAEAKKWVEDWFRKNGSKYNESKELLKESETTDDPEYARSELQQIWDYGWGGNPHNVTHDEVPEEVAEEIIDLYHSYEVYHGDDAFDLSDEDAIELYNRVAAVYLSGSGGNREEDNKGRYKRSLPTKDYWFQFAVSTDDLSRDSIYSFKWDLQQNLQRLKVVRKVEVSAFLWESRREYCIRAICFCPYYDPDTQQTEIDRLTRQINRVIQDTGVFKRWVTKEDFIPRSDESKKSK